jgi:CheY-like chemotaxis protein
MLKILAVDDLHDHAETLVLLCEALGHVGRVAFDGGKAVEIARQFDPDVVFLDLDMPVLDGIMAARAIRQIRSARRCILVALTGRTEFRFRHSAEVAGFDAYMTKPVDIDVLVEFIGRVDRDRRLRITPAMPAL